MVDVVNPSSSDPTFTDAVRHNQTIVALNLTGMHCEACVALIQEILVEQPGVLGATVDLDSATARVEIDPGAVTVDDLCAAVVDAGYGASMAEDSTTGL